MSADRVRIAAADAVALIDSVHGGRLASLVIDGRELLVQKGDDAFHWGSFPMAPWVGRLRHGHLVVDGDVIRFPVNAPPHALHGLVTEARWTVRSADENSVQLEAALGPGELGAAGSWPWPCSVVHTMSLGPDRMDFRLTVYAEVPMPADIGWHPWFVREISTPAGPVPARLDIRGGQVYLNDPDGLPTGELGPPPPGPWDYCFIGLTRPPVVHWPGVLELTVDSDCDHWVLYDVEPPGMCVEPWTGPPNSLNGPDPHVVTPQMPLQARMSWTWRTESSCDPPAPVPQPPAL